jgi:hypothetical protein
MRHVHARQEAVRSLTPQLTHSHVGSIRQQLSKRLPLTSRVALVTSCKVARARLRCQFFSLLLSMVRLFLRVTRVTGLAASRPGAASKEGLEGNAFQEGAGVLGMEVVWVDVALRFGDPHRRRSAEQQTQFRPRVVEARLW